jgi:ATP-dependent NAD(P)H-hydrate dehydratase
MFLVLDADALWYVSNNPSLISGYRRAVLTPNVAEFERLCKSVGVDADADEGLKAALVSQALGGVTILQKGQKDLVALDASRKTESEKSKSISDLKADQMREIVQVDVEGGLKRCGGQGDILSGIVGAFLAWGKCYEDGVFGYVQM